MGPTLVRFCECEDCYRSPDKIQPIHFLGAKLSYNLFVS